MFKKLRIVLGLLFIVALCAGLAACKSVGELDKFDVVVFYDPNGGQFTSEGVIVADGFLFSDYALGADGNYHFKLIEPTAQSRPGRIKSLTKSDYFLAGWYRTRETVTDAEGNVLDGEGNILVEKGGIYYVKGTEDGKTPVISEPSYNYDDRFDFETDEMTVNPEDGKVRITLYAGWVPYYSFHYYTQVDGEWVKYGETSFNYGVVKEGTGYADRNTIWTPDWADGAMKHEHAYLDNVQYTFPQVENSTFVAAYSDAACADKDKIESSFVHKGTLDVAHAKAIDRVQNIYVKVEEGIRFRIENAGQLAANVNLAGRYEILNDLVFDDNVFWPAAFVTGTFTGSFVAESGQVTIKGAAATFNSQSAEFGGLFGRIGENAVVKNIIFEDAQLDIVATYYRQNCDLALFSGEIDDNATVENVTVGGVVKLGQILAFNDNSSFKCRVNMLVNGENKKGVKCSSGGIKLEAYGEDYVYYYLFTVNPEATHVDTNGDVNIVFTQSSNEQQKSQENYDITTWRQQNG